MNKKKVRYANSRLNVAFERDKLVASLSDLQREIQTISSDILKSKIDFENTIFFSKSQSGYSTSRKELKRKVINILDSLRSSSFDILSAKERFDDFIDDVDDYYVPSLTEKSKDEH